MRKTTKILSGCTVRVPKFEPMDLPHKKQGFCPPDNADRRLLSSCKMLSEGLPLNTSLSAVLQTAVASGRTSQQTLHASSNKPACLPALPSSPKCSSSLEFHVLFMFMPVVRRYEHDATVRAGAGGETETVTNAGGQLTSALGTRTPKPFPVCK